MSHSTHCVFVEHHEFFFLKKKKNIDIDPKTIGTLKLPLAFANKVRSAFKRAGDTFTFNPNALLTSRLAIAVQVLGLVAGRGATVSALSFDSLIPFLRGLVLTSAKGVFKARSAVQNKHILSTKIQTSKYITQYSPNCGLSNTASACVSSTQTISNFCLRNTANWFIKSTVLRSAENPYTSITHSPSPERSSIV